ncbi:MAG: NAD(P)H-hydrate dehydratase [Defluviimonas sp.]|nr:NAD(P)H-hydrate dehydratase [Defluviimonas sp.]
MTEILTSAQMRAIEAAAIASGAVTGLELMERAGRGVLEAVLAEWPALAAAPRRGAVFCGPGNNGGDGFVLARLLRQRGWEVELFLYGDPAALPPDARANCARWRGMGELTRFDDRDVPRPSKPDLIVDALFGTGLTRPLSLAPPAGRDPRAGAGGSPVVVAVDVPSGLCADSGRLLGAGAGGACVRADLTVTFHRAKCGHYLAEGPEWCGKLAVHDIGLAALPRPAAGTGEAGPCRLIGPPAGLAKRGGHKYRHGHALVLSGGVGRGGAARLAARGALRIGAGLVTLACPPAALVENAARLDAIMLRPLKGQGEAAALAGLLEDARINALCLGPGMGVARAAALLPVALGAQRATVLDADALTALAGEASPFARLHGACILTPHAGEFARLFPDIAERLAAPASRGPAYSRLDATRDAAARAGCTVLLKGPDTVIAAPGGEAALNAAAYDRAAPWLATAGAGDVLAGFIAGLLARGLDPFPAAAAAAWLHVEAARSFGPGLIAEDLPERLPALFRALEG